MNKLLKVFFFFLLFKNCLAESFLSDDFKDALISAFNNNPKIMSERAKLYEIDELYPQALSSFRPVIEGFYNKGKTDTSTSGSNFISNDGVKTETSKGIIITQRVFDGGSSLSEISEAKNLIISQRYKLKSIEQEILLNATKVYAKITSQYSNLKLSKKNVEFLKKQFESTKNQFEIGDLTLTDVSIAKSRLLLAESNLIKVESELEAIKEEYLSIIGKYPDNPELFFNFPKFKKNLEEIKNSCIQRNPDILSMRYLILSEEKKISRLYRKKLPSVELKAELRKDSGYFKFDSDREIMSAYANVDIPIYQSGLAASKIRESKQKMESTKELLKSEINDLKYNIVNFWFIFRSSDSKINAYKEQVKANTNFLEGLNQEFFLGERTILDVLDGEQELLMSELDLVKSLEEYFNSFFEILSLQGDLNPIYLNLPVKNFNYEENFNKVKFKWLDIVE